MNKIQKDKQRPFAIFTIISIITILIGLITGIYITQKSTNLYTHSQISTRLLASSGVCPTTSSQTYESIKPDTPAQRKISNPENSPEVNINLRGWGEVNEAKELINYGGDTDPNPPPSFGSIFSGRWPKIVKTYIIYEWDWENNRSNIGKSATPAWPVHLIGIDAALGEPLLGLKAGRSIFGDYSLMVLYASESSITFTHSTGDTAPPNDDGYPIYFVDMCVDPNLLAKYKSDNAGGRQVLPAIRPGQIFGYAKDTDVKVAIRDTGSFMDPRAKKDWWQFGPPDGPTYPPNLPSSSPPTLTPPTLTIAPAISPTTVLINTPTKIPYIQPTNILPSGTIQILQPTTYNQQPTTIPTPTITLTPTPTKTLSQKIIGSPAFILMKNISSQISEFLKIILP